MKVAVAFLLRGLPQPVEQLVRLGLFIVIVEAVEEQPCKAAAPIVVWFVDFLKHSVDAIKDVDKGLLPHRLEHRPDDVVDAHGAIVDEKAVFLLVFRTADDFQALLNVGEGGGEVGDHFFRLEEALVSTH